MEDQDKKSNSANSTHFGGLRTPEFVSVELL